MLMRMMDVDADEDDWAPTSRGAVYDDVADDDDYDDDKG